MDKSGKLITEWTLVFTGSKLKHWLIDRLQPGFQHCYAVKDSPGGEFWMILDSKNSFMDVELVSKLDYPALRVLCNERNPDCVILPIRAKIDPDRNRWTFCVINCVEICKSVLGIRDMWLWTPYQLYKHLRGYHGEQS